MDLIFHLIISYLIGFCYIAEMRLIRFQILVLILLAYTILITHPLRITIGDLGRHFINGKLIVTKLSIPKTNLFTYTNQNFPFINHHWGFGVIAYLISQNYGFVTLQILFIILSLATFLIFFDIARRYANFYLAVLLSILILPLLGSRPDTRPEIFSNLFSGIFFWILLNYRQGRTPAKFLLLLPIIQILWINIHIYFFLGLVITTAFTFESFINYRKRGGPTVNDFRNLSLTLLVSFLVAFINPAGASGVFYPLAIFNNYGFKIGENTSALDPQNILGLIPDTYFISVAIIFLVSSILAHLQLRRSHQPIPVAILLISFLIAGLGATAIRNFALFGYFMLAIIAINAQTLISDHLQKKQINQWIPMTLIGLLILMVIYYVSFGLKGKIYLGFGLEQNEEKAGKFFIENKIAGPIFNDFDIGGYLVYFLYPKYQLFIDNRPEAVPAAFFQNTYIPILEDEQKWQAALSKYQFNTIFFYRLNRTEPALKFMVNRINDPEWSVVFVDNYTIIFLKNNDLNKTVIAQYQITKNITLIYGSLIKENSHEALF